MKFSLLLNPFSSEAIHLAMESRLLRVEEVEEIVQLAAGQHQTINKSGALVVRHLLDVYNLNQDLPQSPSNLTGLAENDLSFQSANAFRLYYKGHVDEACRITSEIIQNFGYYDVGSHQCADY